MTRELGRPASGCTGRGLSPRAPKRRPGQDRQRSTDLELPWRGRPQADKADNPAEQLRPVREDGERITVCRLQGSRPLTLPQPSTRDREARGLLRVDPPKQKRTRRRRRPAELVVDAAPVGHLWEGSSICSDLFVARQIEETEPRSAAGPGSAAATRWTPGLTAFRPFAKKAGVRHT